MRIAIGDVVRVRSDQTLGMVVSITNTGGGAVLHLHTNGRGSLTVSPRAVEHVARVRDRMSTPRAVVTLVVIVIALVIAIANGNEIHGLGAAPLMSVFVAFASFLTIGGLLVHVVNRPRTVRV
ncbi:hypothetical protein FH609_000445 [Streptomyces sp. 3MP-14]|uniref:Uncharacterized protein n=1 Tax=Streptomyces mimosae TaxID=2586635 RepID=A0A5N6ATR6_9ACTN|nr:MULTISPECIES: hypothetical protein [Streptomyces]KAB8171118.1 hypothetical protein FH607_002025 [Streptomyces mimosae]KAB8179530.1 hypothetical protein FH609_000445 [Streptomyces sp. 3MP-14]